MPIAWDEASMGTGFPDIDREHQEWLDYFNKLMDAVTSNKGDAVALDTLHFLKRYTDVHFRHEEACMEQYHCPARERNHAAHLEFLLQLQDIQGWVKETGISSVELVSLMHDMESWLVDHIKTIDVQLKKCIV
jgi:hemerythrin